MKGDAIKVDLINNDRLAELILSYEQWREKEQLDLDAEKLLLDVLRDRREQKLAKIRANDMVGSMSGSILGGLFKKARKVQEGEEDEADI